MCCSGYFVFTQRLLKSMIALSIGLFGLLVASGNILDYETNWQFVQHVLAMDTMEPWFNGEMLKSRAITNIHWQKAGYAGIIVGEALFGLLCLIGGSLILWGAFVAKTTLVNCGKALFTLGCVPAVLVWYTGFAVIGGEYFAMWANQWNGQVKAYTFIGFILLALIYISHKEEE